MLTQLARQTMYVRSPPKDSVIKQREPPDLQERFRPTNKQSVNILLFTQDLIIPQWLASPVRCVPLSSAAQVRHPSS